MHAAPVTLDDLTVDAGDARAAADTIGRHGGVLVRGAIAPSDIASFRGGYRAMIDARLRNAGVSPNPADDLDAAYRRLREVDEVSANALKGLGKNLVDFARFFGLPGITSVLAAWFGHGHFQVSLAMSLFRLDRPHEDRRAFGWHQDYPYNTMSENAITVWAPLTPIDEAVGPMRIVPGSHTTIWPVRYQPEALAVQFERHNVFELADKEVLTPEFDARSIALEPVAPGDVFFLHTKLLHRSGPNRSDRCRWVFNGRYGDLLDATMVGRTWSTQTDRDTWPFMTLHPELVRS